VKVGDRVSAPYLGTTGTRDTPREIHGSIVGFATGSRDVLVQWDSLGPAVVSKIPRYLLTVEDAVSALGRLDTPSV